MTKAPKNYSCWEEFKVDVLSGNPSHSKALEVREHISLIETEAQRKEALKFLDECLKYEDNSIFKGELHEIKKAVLEAGTLKTGNKILFFTDPVEIIPALDVLPDGALITTVPFPAQWEEVDKRGVTRTRREIINMVLTSDLETFPCNNPNLLKKSYSQRYRIPF